MMQIPFHDFNKQPKPRKKKLTKAINKVIASNYFILGKQVALFEKEFAKYLNASYCIGVGNGLEAIQIALLALQIGPGDAVITTPLSAVATTLAIIAVGAIPVFVDTNEKGLLDPTHIIGAINKQTKAILPVHLYGQPCDIAAMEKITRKYNLFLLEDAAQAHGTTIGSKKIGTFGQLGCFSFYPTKNLGTFGDGGAIVTNNKKLANICREIRDYGQQTKYVHIRYGLNSRLDELHAAILRVKLTYLESDNKKRRNLAKRYIKNLSNLPLEIVTNSPEENFHLFVIRTKKRNDLQRYLYEHGIETAVHYPRIIPEQPFLQGKYSVKNVQIAKKITREIISLPCNPFLSKAQIDYICKTIHWFYNKQRVSKAHKE